MDEGVQVKCDTVDSRSQIAKQTVPFLQINKACACSILMFVLCIYTCTLIIHLQPQVKTFCFQNALLPNACSFINSSRCRATGPDRLSQITMSHRVFCKRQSISVTRSPTRTRATFPGGPARYSGIKYWWFLLFRVTGSLANVPLKLTFPSW